MRIETPRAFADFSPGFATLGLQVPPIRNSEGVPRISTLSAFLDPHVSFPRVGFNPGLKLANAFGVI
jgi:hypothetical protein